MAKQTICLKCKTPGSGRFCNSCMNSPLFPLENGLLSGKFSIGNLIGEGSFGAVYKGAHHKLGLCAIKTLISTSPENLASFENEAKILYKLSHPGLPKVTDYEIFEDIGLAFMAMEFIDGNNLEQIIKARNAPLDESVVRRYGIEICDILKYLHDHGIIHRDVKPTNLIEKKDGKLSLVDFGTARGKDGTKTAIGTPAYCPREQHDGKDDHRGDIYTTGVVLHYLATNKEPVAFSFPKIRSLNPVISQDLEEIVERSTQLDPKDRYQSAAEMRTALKQESAIQTVDQIVSSRKTQRKLQETQREQKEKAEYERKSKDLIDAVERYIGYQNFNFAIPFIGIINSRTHNSILTTGSFDLNANGLLAIFNHVYGDDQLAEALLNNFSHSPYDKHDTNENSILAILEALMNQGNKAQNRLRFVENEIGYDPKTSLIRLGAKNPEYIPPIIIDASASLALAKLFVQSKSEAERIIKNLEAQHKLHYDGPFLLKDRIKSLPETLYDIVTREKPHSYGNILANLVRSLIKPNSIYLRNLEVNLSYDQATGLIKPRIDSEENDCLLNSRDSLALSLFYLGAAGKLDCYVLP